MCTLKETVRAVSKRTGLPPIPPVDVTAGPVNEAVEFPETVAFPDTVALPEMEAEELPLSVPLREIDRPLPETEEAVTEPVIDGDPEADPETDE